MKNSFHQNLVWILVQRCGLLILGVLYVALVPKALGPTLFGTFTLIYSVLLWGMTVTESGAQATFTRNFAVRPRTSRHLPATFFLTQILLSLGIGLLAFVVAGVLIGTGLPAAGCFALASVLACSGQAGLGVQLAEGHGSRWGAGFLLRRSVGLAGILIGARMGGWNGIALGILFSEVLIFGAMLYWSGSRLRVNRLSWPRFRPFLWYGISFYLGGLVHMTWRYFGEWRVKSFIGVEEVAYYGLAMGIYVAAEAAVQQIVVLGAPYLSKAGGASQMFRIPKGWKLGLSVGAAGLLLMVGLSPFLAEPVIRMIAGEAYLPSASLLPWMALALLFFLPAAYLNSWVLALGWRKLFVRASLFRLIALAVLSLPLEALGGWTAMASVMCLSNVLYAVYLLKGVQLQIRKGQFAGS